MELRWWGEHVDITAGGEVANVTDWINEKINERERRRRARGRRRSDRG
jgi:hypothetical protein